MRPAILLVALGTLAACGSSGWDTKASESVKQASDAVGGFSDDDKRLYSNSLEHVHNRRQKPGQFTIGAMVDQERAREQQRQDIAAKQRDSHAQANLDASYKKAYDCYDNLVLRPLNQSDEGQVITQRSMTDYGMVVKVDGDKYEYMSQQDQHRLTKILVQGWATCLHRSVAKADITTDGRAVWIKNLAGDELAHELAEVW